MAAILITVTQTKNHLHRPDLADDDPDLLQKMAAAEDAILDYVNMSAFGRTNSAQWTDPDTVPPRVHHAILLKVAELDRFRGDDLQTEGPAYNEGSELSPTITALLRRVTDPVLA